MAKVIADKLSTVNKIKRLPSLTGNIGNNFDVLQEGNFLFVNGAQTQTRGSVLIYEFSDDEPTGFKLVNRIDQVSLNIATFSRGTSTYLVIGGFGTLNIYDISTTAKIKATPVPLVSSTTTELSFPTSITIDNSDLNTLYFKTSFALYAADITNISSPIIAPPVVFDSLDLSLQGSMISDNRLNVRALYVAFPGVAQMGIYDTTNSLRPKLVQTLAIPETMPLDFDQEPTTGNFLAAGGAYGMTILNVKNPHKAKIVRNYFLDCKRQTQITVGFYQTTESTISLFLTSLGQNNLLTEYNVILNPAGDNLKLTLKAQSHLKPGYEPWSFIWIEEKNIFLVTSTGHTELESFRLDLSGDTGKLPVFKAQTSCTVFNPDGKTFGRLPVLETSLDNTFVPLVVGDYLFVNQLGPLSELLGTIDIYKIRERKIKLVNSISVATFQTLSFTRGDLTILVAAGNFEIILYDISTPKKIRSRPVPILGRVSTVTIPRIFTFALSQDTRYLYCNDDQALSVVDLTNLRSLVFVPRVFQFLSVNLQFQSQLLTDNRGLPFLYMSIAGLAQVYIFDTTNPLRPEVSQILESPEGLLTFAQVKNGSFIISGGSSGLSVIDVRKPAVARVVQNIDTNVVDQSVLTVKFLGSRNKLYIVSLGDPNLINEYKVDIDEKAMSKTSKSPGPVSLQLRRQAALLPGYVPWGIGRHDELLFVTNTGHGGVEVFSLA